MLSRQMYSLSKSLYTGTCSVIHIFNNSTKISLDTHYEQFKP